MSGDSEVAMELVGNNSEVMTPQEETQSSEISEMCTGWNSTVQIYNITTGITIRILQSLTSDKAQLVTNNTISSYTLFNGASPSSVTASIQLMDRVKITKDSKF